jgi:arsenical pump membrane protein
MPPAGRLTRLGPWTLAAVGVAGAIAASVARPSAARAAAGQDWSPFMLVAGLLLIGLVADDDGLFAAAGYHLARVARRGPVLFAGAAAMIGVVTALLNLDTSVAFLTPVLVYAARSRSLPEGALLYGCLMLSNAGSLLLPGSNLTNLIVLGHLRMTGGQFAARMWLPWLAALLITGVVVAVAERRSLPDRSDVPDPAKVAGRPELGIGLAAVVAVTLVVLFDGAPALPVLAIGVVAVALAMARHRATVRQAANVLGIPLLTGLFGIAVALGALGRAWPGPAILLSHLNGWLTALVAAVATVLVNNLPAASLLAARTPDHPFSLLVGLNLGPNLCVTGSLAWLLWLRAARSAGARPSLARASRIGAVAVPLSLAAALAGLALTGLG